MAKLFKGETMHTQENIEAGGGSIPAGIYRRGPNGTLIRCSGAYIKQALKDDEEKKEKEKQEEKERERKKKEKEISIYSHPDVKPKLKSCKCGRYHATCEAKEVVEIWNKHLRDGRKMHETNMRIVLFAPLLYNRSTLAPKWQQWMRKLDLIIDDMAPLERKKEVFFRLDELDKVLEYIHTKLSTMQTDDYDRMTWLLEEVEKVDELQVAMEVAKSNSYFVTFYDNLKTRKKMKDSRVSRLMALVTIKQYWQYVHHTVIHKKEILATLMKLSEKDEKDMNSLKDRGNNLFKNNKFRNAHEMYTKALAIGVFNHILYSNRCQTALHMEDFWDALWDARRAVTIKPDWQKGHYRYAQAFFELKDIDRALRENKRGQKLCDDGGSQTGDLQRQATMFNDEKKRLVSLNSKKNEVPDLVSESETDSDSDSDRKGKSRKPSKLPDINQDLQKSKEDFKKKKAEEAKKKKEEELRKEKEVADRKQREAEERERKRQEEQEIRRRQRIMHDVEASNKSSEEDEKRKAERTKRKAEKAERKRKEAEKQAQERLKRDEKDKHTKEKEKQAKREAEIARQQKEQMRRENERLTKERNAIEKCLADGSLALVSGQSRQAITQYDRAAELLKATKKEHCGMHEADYLVFLYAQATAYLKSGIPLEINEALSRFESITKDFPNMRNGLPFYGMATALFKLNRFTEALDPIEKSLFITTRFDQTIHTWPGTSTNIEETEEGKLEAALKELQRWCKNPPSADATCRYMECTSKREMYFSDLDFKGYIKVQCSERCYIDYHINCWKAIKNESNILGEKEALKTKCSTPDCLGTLSYIKVIEGNGIVKTEFKVEKPPKPAKDEAKKKSAPKPNKDQKKGKKFRKYHQSESYKAEKGQGDAEGQPGHGQTAEGAHAEKEDASSKSTPGATKPRTGSDAGIAAATDFTQNDASRIQMVEGAEGDAEIKPEATYVLKRDEFDDVEQKKTNKAQPKKSRKPATLHEEASNIVQFDFGPTTRHLYGADDAEELQERKNRWQSTLTVSEDRPFAIPEYLQDAARKMDASFQKEGFIIVPETDEEKSQKTVLFLHFNDIFSSNGPLYLQDPIITRYMEHLTFEHQELIIKRGGLKPLLLESEDMVVIGDYASMKGDAQKCRELAIRNGYQERELSGDVAGYSLNPNSVPFIPGLGGYNPTLSVGLDQFDDAKRGPVSGLDSFEGDEESDEEDGEDDNEIKTEESEGTKNESDTITTSSDDEDDDDDDSDDDNDDDNDEAEDSFHDASSEMHASNYEGIESELYQSILEGNVTVRSNSKVDGIDDEDYHWEDHYSSKELTMEEVDDDEVVHGETDKNGEQSHVQRGGEGTMGNTGASNNIESKDTVGSAEGRERQENVTKLPVPSEVHRSDFELTRDGIGSRQSEHGGRIQRDGPRSVVSVLSDVQESASIAGNSEKTKAVASRSRLPTGQSSAESNEMTSELNKGAVNQSVRPDEASSDDGTSVDGVLNPRLDDEVVGASNSKKLEQPLSIPVATPVSNSTHVVNTETTKVNRKESRKESQELQRTQLSESDYEKMFEKRMQQWKDQQPPVHEQRTFGTNTDDYVNQQMESLQRALEQAENNKKISEVRMIEYREAINRRADEKIRSLQEKYQKDLDQREKKAKEEKQLLFNSLHQVEAEYLKQNKRLNVLEEYEESRERTEQNLADLKVRHEKKVLDSADETESLKSEIGILRNSVKDKEKTNKMLEKQSKKLTVEKQELHDNVSRLQCEMALLNEDRLTADSRRTQMEKDMEESKKVPKELKEAMHALELRLKARDEEAVKSLGRACKAESQFLHLFMAKELKPLEEACKEANTHIQTIANILQNNPMMEEHVRAIRSMWQDCLATNQRAASKAQNEFQKQVNAIQNGATLDSMKPVEVPAPYKPEGLVKGASGSPTPQPALTLPSSMNHETGMAAPAPGSWTMSAPRMQPVDHQDGMIAAPTAEGVPQNGGAMENPPASHTNPEAQRKAMAMAQAEAMAEAQAQAQAQEQAQAQAQAQALAHAQAQAQAKAKAQQIQQAQAMSRAQTPPVVSQGEATIQQAAMSGNGFNHHQQSNAIPPNMQHAQHQMQMSQQQGAAARHQHQVQQQQMLARQQYMEQQVARPKNSFERIMLRLHGFFPNYNKVQLTGFLKEVRTSNNGSLSGLSVEEIIRRVKDLVRQRQRETAGNASQRMQNKGFANHQGMSGGRPTAPPATFNAQPKRSSYHNAPTPPQPAWSTVGHIQGLNWHKELVDGEAEEEDPCVICHDEMSGDNTLEIECGHIFHIHCLQEWLKQQQTCPTCRNFTILKDDYPSLHK